MANPQKVLAACLPLLLLAVGPAWSAPAINEAAAFLVFPRVASPSPSAETLLTVSNTSAAPYVVRLTFVNGATCFTCDFDVVLPARGSSTIAAMRGTTAGTTRFRGLANEFDHTCPGDTGFVTANLRDPGTGVVRYDNVLIGSQVIVDYADGHASSMAAIPIQALGAGDGDTRFEFDDVEFERLPRLVASAFLAPDFTPGLDASLVLFTLGFVFQAPPLTDCSIIGSDTTGTQFSDSFQFGCWTEIRLGDIDPEYQYPFLGSPGPHEHGWLTLNCRVDSESNGSFEVLGGVHGALFQKSAAGTVLRRQSGGPALNGATAWSAQALQSVTDGTDVTLRLLAPPLEKGSKPSER